MNDKTTIIDAVWDTNQSMYICSALACWSEDGDNWYDDFGGQPDSEEFHRATIRLVGGPRDGTEVS